MRLHVWLHLHVPPTWRPFVLNDMSRHSGGLRGKRTERQPCLEAAAMNLSYIEIWFLNFQEIKNWVVCWQVFQPADWNFRFWLEGECLQRETVWRLVRTMSPKETVCCRSSITRSCLWLFSLFLLGSWQLLLIPSPCTGYRLRPVHSVLCIRIGSFIASLFKSFQAHNQHYLQKAMSDGWALYTKKTQREKWNLTSIRKKSARN